MPVVTPLHLQAQEQQRRRPPRFEDVWRTFHDKIASKAGTADAATVQQRVQCLEAVTNVLFGLNTSKKAIATQEGCFELILLLAKQEEGDDTVPLLLPTLKAFKSALVNNPEGRNKCRAMGVMEFLINVANSAISSDEIVEEELWTTVAAMCLGHELNALQATIQLEPRLATSRKSFPPEQYTSLESKRVYLTALFDVMKKQEIQLIEYLSEQEDENDFWKRIEQAERMVLLPSDATANNGGKDEELTACVDALQPTLSLTNLAHALYVDLVEQRLGKANVKAEIALVDLQTVIEAENLDSQLRHRIESIKESLLLQQQDKSS